MGEPRWTVDPKTGGPVFADGRRSAGVSVGGLWVLGAWHLDDRLAFARGAYYALVAAVRDAELLHQARATLRAAYDAWLEAVEDDKDEETVERLFAQLIVQLHPILLPSVERPPLLSPVADSGDQT